MSEKKISWKQRINPLWWFGNIDNPEPPDWFEPTQLNYERRRDWRFRNPLHNLTWYVIGIADREFTACGKAPGSVFVDGWNYTFLKTTHLPVCSFMIVVLAMIFMQAWPKLSASVLLLYCLWMLLPYPFFSYRGKMIKFYIGWRPDSGAFGMKLTTDRR